MVGYPEAKRNVVDNLGPQEWIIKSVSGPDSFEDVNEVLNPPV